MMTPRETLPEPIRAALLNASGLHKIALRLGQLMALPASGLSETVGVQAATLARAMSGKLVPVPAAKKIWAWYEHAGRFLPKIDG